MPLPDPPVEVEFRDGVRSIPPHVASNIAISGIDPYEYTFEEAVEISNNAILRNYVTGFARDLVNKHFVENR